MTLLPVCSYLPTIVITMVCFTCVSLCSVFKDKFCFLSLCQIVFDYCLFAPHGDQLFFFLQHWIFLSSLSALPAQIYLQVLTSVAMKRFFVDFNTVTLWLLHLFLLVLVMANSAKEQGFCHTLVSQGIHSRSKTDAFQPGTRGCKLQSSCKLLPDEPDHILP